MAVVAKWLTHRIVVPAFVGSRPIGRPIFIEYMFEIRIIMAIVAKGLTHRIVVPAFVGSSPISRPIFLIKLLGISQAVRQRTLTPSRIGSNPIFPAIFMRTWLSGRASPCQGEGRGFDSRRPLHYYHGAIAKW